MAEISDNIDAELENVERVLSLLPKAESLSDLSTLELAGVSTLLHNFYNGIENILKQLVKERGMEVPSGPSWHRDLLDSSINSRIISKAMGKELLPYLGFRHFFTHGYATDLDPEKLDTLVRDARSTLCHLKSDITDTKD